MKKRVQNKTKIVIGLTGNFGSGKTTVAKILHSWGARVIDADKIARALLTPGTQIYQEVIRVFGRGILKKDRTINRRKLGRLVFEDKKLRRQLNKIIHPPVIRIIRRKLRSYHRGIIVLDAALLIEAGLMRLVDRLVVVKISPREQLRRLQDKTSLSRLEILKRINAQMAQNRKIRLADFIIDNSGTIKQTRKQVGEIRRVLWKN